MEKLTVKEAFKALVDGKCITTSNVDYLFINHDLYFRPDGESWQKLNGSKSQDDFISFLFDIDFIYLYEDKQKIDYGILYDIRVTE